MKKSWALLIGICTLILGGCFDPDYGEVRCSENMNCPPGMVCDPADNRCRAVVSEPECRMDSDCASGACDQNTGMCVAGCRPETCTAGPCETARCEGDMCVVESLCGAGEMCCGNACVPEGCDDGVDCTDDSCGASGCEHTPNTGASCDDGEYCNGADTCTDGACTGHAGDPCTSPTVCAEDIDMCTECTMDAHCPDTVIGAWSECSGFGDVCDQSGTRSRTVTTYTCDGTMCVPTTTTETEACTRITENNSCGPAMYGQWGSCGEFSDTCDQGGMQYRDVTTYSCVSEVCTASTVPQGQACTRVTEGVTCQSTVTGSWSACSGYNNTCDESGDRSRSVTSYACASETCAPTTTTETASCMRNTDGLECAPDAYGSWSTCGGYTGTCDEGGTQSRSVTSYGCANETCDSTLGSETRACYRDTDGNSCGSSSCGSWGSCGGYSSTCDETGIRYRTCTDPICGSGNCNSVSRTESQSCLRDTDGNSCGTVTCTAWSTCGYTDTCDENATQTRTCTAPECTSGGCANRTYTETQACNRSTTGVTCGTASCGRWGLCSGYSSTCDETGNRSRTCYDAPTCSGGTCQPAPVSGTETQICYRDTDGLSCGTYYSCVNGICEINCLRAPSDQFAPICP